MILISQTSHQKSEVIQKSLSITMLHEKPKQHSTCSKNSSAKSAAVMSSQVGINSVYLVTQHTTVRMLLYSWPFLNDSDKSIIQSRLISLNSEFHVSVEIDRDSNLLYDQ